MSDQSVMTKKEFWVDFRFTDTDRRAFFVDTAEQAEAAFREYYPKRHPGVEWEILKVAEADRGQQP